ncbi:SDR family NAD(P)-dependent oxidoreductase [Nocardia sp. NPDC101769]|uniref:SDR family NAD(P)-dependent oxidoreductase n=1 Tax=Nocardia sp. NPDC101769 TaxID=3364333 RepID=UPI00381C41DA
MYRLEKRRILVTGAGSGIGQATVLRLLSEGAVVVGAGLSAEGLALTRKKASEAGLDARFTILELNIASETEVIAGVESAVESLGGLDALVNAAGMLRAGRTHETSLDLWNQIINVNLTGTFLMIREALPALLTNSCSTIVNFSSTSASFAHPYMAAYSASKGGIQSLTHALALEYGKQGLRAVSVAPGGIKSGITDATPGYLPKDSDWRLFGRLTAVVPQDNPNELAGPENVAGVIAMLVSDDGRFISGTEIRIDGAAHT